MQAIFCQFLVYNEKGVKKIGWFEQYSKETGIQGSLQKTNLEKVYESTITAIWCSTLYRTTKKRK